MIGADLVLRVLIIIVSLAVPFTVGWHVNGWRVGYQVKELQATQARQLARREAIARRAIESARQQERGDVDAMAAVAAEYQARSGRLAADAAATRGRLRDAIAAARASRLPTACADSAGPDRAADPLEILGEAGGRILGIGDEADALSVRAAALREIVRHDRGP